MDALPTDLVESRGATGEYARWLKIFRTKHVTDVWARKLWMFSFKERFLKCSHTLCNKNIARQNLEKASIISVSVPCSSWVSETITHSYQHPKKENVVPLDFSCSCPDKASKSRRTYGIIGSSSRSQMI